MSDEKIFAIIKEPGRRPRAVWISPKLSNLQKHVGGYIEVHTLASDAAAICNEEGRLIGMPYCCYIGDLTFVGLVLLIGVKGEEFASWPLSYKKTKQLFPNMWEGIQ